MSLLDVASLPSYLSFALLPVATGSCITLPVAVKLLQYSQVSYCRDTSLFFFSRPLVLRADQRNLSWDYWSNSTSHF